MRSSLSLTVAGLVTLVFAAAAGPHQQASAQTTTVIEVGDFWFCDSSFQSGVCETTISVGDSIQWQWVGSSSHTTTECGGDLDACSQPHLWDSPVQSAGTFSFSFDSAGSFVYRCQVHPSAMRGGNYRHWRAHGHPVTHSHAVSHADAVSRAIGRGHSYPLLG